MNIDLLSSAARNTLLTLEQCEKLSTKRLLTYFKKYRRLEHYGVCGCCYEILREGDVEINEAFTEYFDAIRKILNEREHV